MYLDAPHLAVAAMRGLLRALCQMHAAGVAHYDVKLHNIMYRRADGFDELDVALVDLGACTTKRECTSVGFTA